MTHPNPQTAKPKKKPTAKPKAPTRAAPTKPTSTRKEVRTGTPEIDLAPVGRTRAGAVDETTKPRLQRTVAVKSGLSTLAKDAIERVRAAEASAALTPAAKQTVPAPTVAPERVPATVAKTKRQGLVTDSTNEELRKLNRETNLATLTDIYKEFYLDDGERINDDKDLATQLKRVYGMMGKGGAAYVQKPVGDEEFKAFKAQPNAEIEAQGMWAPAHSGYAKAKKTYDDAMLVWNALPARRRPPEPMEPTPPPKDLDEAVGRGDYFHVHNTSSLRPAEEEVIGRSRRIIVNVNSQQAGLKVAERMNRLYTDAEVSPNLDHYKIYLTRAKPTDRTTVKHDKLVIYYSKAKGEAADEDAVGDRIAEAIQKSVGRSDLEDEFAPFYARVAPGIAWAEEPQDYVKHLTSSFTRTRAQVIEGAISNTPKVKDLAEFVRVVDEALKTNYVDPQNPHRHLAGMPPAARVRKKHQPKTAPPTVTASPKPVAGPPTASRKPPTKVSTMAPPKRMPPLPPLATPVITGT